MLPEVAVIFALPAVTPMARPVVLTVASALDVVQVRPEVRVCVVLSLKWPVAVNCWVPLTLTEALAGLRVMDCKVAGAAVTTRAAELLVMPLCVAVTVTLPAATPLAKPAVLIVASAVLEEFQVAVEVKSWVLLSLKVAVALNCWVAPAAIEAEAGVTVMDFNVTAAAVTVSVIAELATLPDVALMFVLPAATPVATPVVAIVAAAVLEEAQVTPLVRV